MKNTDLRIVLARLAAQPRDSEQCPDSEELFCLAAGERSGHQKRRLLGHLGRCSDCFRTYSDVKAVLDADFHETGSVTSTASPGTLSEDASGEVNRSSNPGFAAAVPSRGASYRGYAPFALAASLVLGVLIVGQPEEPEFTLDSDYLSAEIAADVERFGNGQSIRKSLPLPAAAELETDKYFAAAYMGAFRDRRDQQEQLNDGSAAGTVPFSYVDALRDQCQLEADETPAQNSAAECLQAIEEGARLGAALADVQGSCIEQSPISSPSITSGQPSINLADSTRELLPLCAPSLGPCSCADWLLSQGNWSGIIASN